MTYTPLSRKFDPETSYKKALRVNCDFYDPKSDQYLLIEYMFSEMYNAREICAYQLDCSPQKLVTDPQLAQICLLTVKENKTDLT